MAVNMSGKYIKIVATQRVHLWVEFVNNNQVKISKKTTKQNMSFLDF